MKRKYLKLLMLGIITSSIVLTSGCKKKEAQQTDDLTNINKIFQDEMKNAESAVSPESASNTINEEATNKASSDNEKNTGKSLATITQTSVSEEKEKLSVDELFLIPQDSNKEILATGFFDKGYISIYKDNTIDGGQYEILDKIKDITYSVSFNEYNLTDDGIKTLAESNEDYSLENMLQQTEEGYFCKYSCENIQYDENSNPISLDLQKRTMYLQKDRNGQYTTKYGDPIAYKVVSSEEFFDYIRNYYKSLT